MPNGRSRGRRRGRRPKRRSNEKGGRTVQTPAPALFAFMGSLSSSVGLSAWRWACAVPRCGSRCFRNGQRKAIIRTHRLSETGSDYIGLVRLMGLEPIRSPIRPSNVRVCLFRHNRIFHCERYYNAFRCICQHKLCPKVNIFLKLCKFPPFALLQGAKRAAFML